MSIYGKVAFMATLSNDAFMGKENLPQLTLKLEKSPKFYTKQEKVIAQLFRYWFEILVNKYHF